MLLAFDRANGRLLWERTVAYEEPEPTHETNPYCSASPASDGERIVVSHGSAGVFAYDLEGKELWRRDLGKFHHIWGNASSPVLRGDLCFLNCGPGARTFLVALDKTSGKTVWQVDIPGGQEGGEASTWTGSWSTPLLAGPAGREDLLVSYPHRLHAYDPATGSERWKCEGLGKLVYTSPIAGEGVVAAMSGFMGPALAVRAGGEGDVTAARRLWHEDRAQQRIGSGMILEGRIYIVNETGVVDCRELESGKQVWRERVSDTTWSSLVLADGLFYLIDQEGETHVFRPGDKFERVARNPLAERTRASPALSNGEIFIRTYRHLWCIGKEK
jgi:outer membrane protein assembly factor BamB